MKRKKLEEYIKQMKGLTEERKKQFFDFLIQQILNEKVCYLLEIDVDGTEYLTPPGELIKYGFSADDILDIMLEVSKNDEQELRTIVNTRTKEVKTKPI